MSYLCTTNGTKGAFFPTMYRLESSGCSAVRLAHLLWEQGVPGSNPGTPTEKLKQSLKTTVEWQMSLYCRFIVLVLLVALVLLVTLVLLGSNL